MIVIDGSQGEGGGQVLRTSLSLSMVTSRPFRIEKIRAGRKKPGLMRQHLTCVNAAAEVCGAQAMGNEISSTALEFLPGPVKAGSYRFTIGTAGSATLVFQTVLPALMIAETSSQLTLVGGTHNPFAPPFDFLERVFVPVVERIGPRIELILQHYGFYPAGGGRFQARIHPAPLTPIELLERGSVVSRRGEAFYSLLPEDVAARELKVIGRTMNIGDADLFPRKITHSPGPGNMAAVTIESEHITELFTGFGQKGIPAERVANSVCRQALDYLAAGVPVGIHLADQLLIPLALAGGGRFLTLKPDPHTWTNIDVIQTFLEIAIQVQQKTDRVWEITVGASG